MKAALIVQNSIAGDFKNNIASTLDFISKAFKKEAKIVVFPEMNLTGYVSGSDIFSICRSVRMTSNRFFSKTSSAPIPLIRVVTS